MAEKVLKLFWSLAHSTDVTTDIMDQALTAHVKILDYSCTQNRLVGRCIGSLITLLMIDWLVDVVIDWSFDRWLWDGLMTWLICWFDWLIWFILLIDWSRDEQKSRWLDKCVEELKANEQWVLPALKQIKDICTLYQVQNIFIFI